MADYLMVVYRPEWGDNRARDLLRSRGHGIDTRCPAWGDRVPASPSAYAGVIIGGGLDGVLVGTRLPYVDALIALARSCIDRRVPFLGFCFGAQVLAAAAGGRVSMRPDRRGAFGYRRVKPLEPEGDVVLAGLSRAYHLHFHGFEAPPGAVSLAVGDLFPSSAFRVGANAYGFQFHPEIRADQIESVLSHLGPQALQRPGADPADRHLADAARYDGTVHAWLERFMETWIDVDASAPPTPGFLRPE